MVRYALASLRKRYPDLQVSDTDYGQTVAVKRPGQDCAYYITRVFRPERDGFAGREVVDFCTLDRITKKLNGPSNPRRNSKGHRKVEGVAPPVRRRSPRRI
jgi:hypothetical protein